MNLYCFIGPSGSGKSSIVNELFNEKHILKSFTTRKKRNANDNEYHFISEDEYEKLNKDDFIENVTYANNHYGVLKEDFNKVKDTKNVAFICNADGYKHMYETFKDDKNVKVFGIFLSAEKKNIINNLKKRWVTTHENINARIEMFDKETKYNKDVFDEMCKKDAPVVMIANDDNNFDTLLSSCAFVIDTWMNDVYDLLFN